MIRRHMWDMQISSHLCETSISFFFFFDLRGVSGPAYAHHDYSPRPTEHPASPGAGKAPRGDRRAHRGSNPGRGRNKSHDWPQQLDPQVQDQHILKFSSMLLCYFLTVVIFFKKTQFYYLNGMIGVHVYHNGIYTP
jgi:hypothetical protein